MASLKDALDREMVDCEECDGSGYVTVDCDVCDGSGEIEQEVEN